MSPYTIAHGILGLEGIHRLADEIDMNTQGGLPRIQLDRITGIHALPEADDNREPKYGQGGEQVYPSLTRGKTIIYEGRILGADLPQMRAMMHSLRHAASRGRLGETSIVVRPGGFGGVTHSYDARVLALESDDEQTLGLEAMPTAYQRGFVLTVRQSDPRYYLVGGDVYVEAASVDTITVTNPGNAPALPNFIVDGPIPGTLTFDRLDNVVARKLVYEDVGLATGEQLRLDFGARTLRRVSDNASFEHKRVYDDSNWWDAGAAGLNPGATQIRVTGGGNWAMGFAPASW